MADRKINVTIDRRLVNRTYVLVKNQRPGREVHTIIDMLFVGKVRDIVGLYLLEDDICAFIDIHNTDPKPFRWAKPTDDILGAIQRFCTRTKQISRTSRSRH